MCNCVYLARIKGGDGGGYRMGCCKPLWPPAPPLLFSTLSEALFYGTGGAESGSEAEGNLAYLCGILLFSTIWIMIAPIHLPSLFLLFTLSRKHRLSSHSLARLPLCFLPFSVRPHPCLSRQLTFLTSALFPPEAVSSSPLGGMIYQKCNFNSVCTSSNSCENFLLYDRPWSTEVNFKHIPRP